MADAAATTETPVETPAVETPAAETPAAETPEVAEENSVSSDGQFIKVFVGNIDYKVTDEQLKEFFKDLKFVDAAINKRKDVSVGYGFITFDDEEEAKKCVEQFDKKDFQGRPLKVELAKEKTETTKRRGSRRNMRGKGRRSNNSFRRRKNTDKDSKKESEGSADEGSSNDEGKTESSGSESNTEGSNKKRSFRKKRFRQRKPREGGEPSKTTIYVANLPFKTDDEKLREAFKDYEVSKVHVARYKGGKSKGFGFIEVENEEVQKKILVECSNKIIDGRAISLKVALNFTKEEAEKMENAVENTEAIAVAAEN
jgi:RNA recognition motif-containing protein